MGVRVRPRIGVRKSECEGHDSECSGMADQTDLGAVIMNTPEFAKKVLGVSRSKSSSLAGSAQWQQSSTVGQVNKTLREHKVKGEEGFRVTSS